jgi:hypothetical protein
MNQLYSNRGNPRLSGGQLKRILTSRDLVCANLLLREWGSIRKQPNKSARFQASFNVPELRRHFAPVTYRVSPAARMCLTPALAIFMR